MASAIEESAATTDAPTALHLVELAAVLSLVMYHYLYQPSAAGTAGAAPLQGLARLGFVGIDVFLMASGYLIVRTARGHSALEFIRARLLRRFPEFWIAVLISGTLFHFAPIHPGRYPSAATVAANLSMVPQVLGFEMVDALYQLLFEELQFSFVIWAVLLLGLFAEVEYVLFAIIGLSLAGTVTTLPFVLRALIDFPVGPLFATGGLLALVHHSGWTARRAFFMVLAGVGGSILTLREMTAYVEPAEISIATESELILVLVLAGAALAAFGDRAIGARAGGYGAVLAGLAYPLLLLESTGKALFLRGLVHAPRAVLIVCALAFSLAVAIAVWRLGTGPLRGALDRLLPRVGRTQGDARP